MIPKDPILQEQISHHLNDKAKGLQFSDVSFSSDGFHLIWLSSSPLRKQSWLWEIYKDIGFLIFKESVSGWWLKERQAAFNENWWTCNAGY